MKIFFAIVLSIVLLLLFGQIYKFSTRKYEIRKELSDLKAQLDSARADQSKLQSELSYYLNPANLEKELRARFNYKEPGEGLIIVVPGNTSSASSSGR